MRKRRLLFALGASLAALALTVGTALADPAVGPTVPDANPPIPIGTGAQTLEGLFDDLCNNVFAPANSKCAFYDIEPVGSTITTRPTPPHSCTFTRPNGTVDGENALINRPDCVSWGAAVTASNAASLPPGFTFIPVARDALSYAFRSDGTVPPDLDIPTLRRIYTCDPALTGGPNPPFHPLIGVRGAGNRTLWLQTLGIAEGPDLTTRFPCITEGFPANDGTVLRNPNELITYSSATYLAQVNQAEVDRHGPALLGNIDGKPVAVLNDQSTIARDVYDFVRTSDTTNGSPIQSLFVGPNSMVCSQQNVIKRHGFNILPTCGNTSLVTGSN